MPGCSFELVSSGQLASEIEETTRLTLYFYRVTVNEHSRSSRRPASGCVPEVNSAAWIPPVRKQLAMPISLLPAVWKA